MSKYLFTDDKGKKIEMKDFAGRGRMHNDEGKLSKNAPGMQAITYRAVLQKKHKKQVVAWAHMGGDNAQPIE